MVTELRKTETAEGLLLVPLKDFKERVNTRAGELGLENLIVDLADYNWLPITLDSNEQGIEITLNVPCMKPNTLMTIYKYKSLPIPIIKKFTNGVQAALYIEAFEGNAIAVGHDNSSFMLPNDTDLKCKVQFGKVKLCEGLTELRTDLNSSCLAALLLQNEDRIKTNCIFEIKKLSLDYVSTGHSDYTLISPDTYTLRLECPDRFGKYQIKFVEIPRLKYARMTLAKDCWVSISNLGNSAGPHSVKMWSASNLSLLAFPMIADFNLQTNNNNNKNNKFI